ncbi:MAG: MAPEG family protein [Proteobacteria bacterium]|nr:MAPEG family protein [Pseudomonadota bacterium]
MPAITAFYAGITALLLVVLGLRVSVWRRRSGVGIGDGGHRELTRAIRVHANLSEWAWPVLLLLLLAELNRAPDLLLHVAGIAFVTGRVLHAVGLTSSAGVSFGRFTGIILTWTIILVLGAWDIWAFLRLVLR